MISKCFIVAFALFATAALADKGCHNVTGTCLSHGFVCANEQVVKHAARCDGVEDCADGTDEFMCEHPDPTPLHQRSHEHRHAFEQASCVNCNCEVNVMDVKENDSWFSFALAAPTDPKGLMTGDPNHYGGMPCNHQCTKKLRVAFYKKNGVCRGWLCCARQRQCLECHKFGTCSGKGNHDFWSRCYKN